MGENITTTSDEVEGIRSIRRSFRVPVGPGTGISAVLKGTSYPVSDISPEGVRIQGLGAAQFSMDEVIGDCALNLPGDKVSKLTARLTHMSDRKGSGIHWVGMPDASLMKVAAHVARIKKRLRKTIQDQPA